MKYGNDVRAMALSLLLGPGLLGQGVSSSSLYGQSTVSVVGNKWLKFPVAGSTAGIVESPLPIPDDPAAIASGLAYNGATPKFSQYLQLDDLNMVLFFVVDGNVYDRKGYLIATVSDEAPSTSGIQPFPYLDGKLKPGRGEVVASPVPGRCATWYLIHTGPTPGYGNAILGFSVLDFNLTNPHFPGSEDRHGRMLDLSDLFDQGFETSGTSMYLDEFGEIPEDPEPLNGTGPVIMEMVHNPTTGRSFLLVSTGYYLAKYALGTNGIAFLGTDAIFHDPLFAPFRQGVKGEIATYNVGSTIRVALSFNDLFVDNPPPPLEALVAITPHMRFATLDATDPALAQLGAATTIPDGAIEFPITQQDGQGQVVEVPGIGGVEFSEDGDNVYWLKSFGNEPGTTPTTLMMAKNWYATMPTLLLDLVPVQMVDSKLERHTAPDGIGMAIYASGTLADGTFVLGTLTGTNDAETAVWTTNAFETTSISLCEDQALNAIGTPPPYDRYHLLSKQMAEDRSIPLLVLEHCCEVKHRITGYTNYKVDPGSEVWTTTDNPFCNSSEVRINGELRILSGANVIANHMTFSFAPGATMVIERGAKFTSYGCTFTNGCEERWAGIRVEGNTDNHVQTQTGTPVEQRQGWLTLDLSTIENADVGVWCAKEVAPGIITDEHFGGVVRATNTTFRNCTYGVRVESYDRMNGDIELDNLSHFSNCEFITTGSFPNGLYDQPKVHATLSNVRGITLANCRFLNTEPSLFLDERRGRGIEAFNAGFKVQGNNDPNNGCFENLSMGVVALCGPLRTYQVDRMHFAGNMWGIFDLTSVAARITRNTFHVPDWDNFVRPPIGLVLLQSTSYLVEENIFHGFNRNNNFGIYFLGPQQAENRVYNNIFSNLMAGTMVAGRHKGNDPPFERQGLQILCGDYFENTVDYGLGSYTYIREDQGDVDPVTPSLSQLAGNRWLDPADLSSSFDIWIHPEQYEGSGEDPSPFFDYKRHDVAVCDPLNTSPFFSDQPQAWALDFIKEEACAGGNLTPPPGPGTVSSRFSAVAAELKSAVSYFTGTVNDGGANLDIIEAIAEDHPPLASHVLRDYLLARTPLHDEVMIAMLHRSIPMDAWHVTQVLLSNCKLSSKVWGIAKNVGYLSPYQLNLIETARDDSQVMQLLKQEVAQKSSEKAKLQTHVLYDLLTDSTTTNRYGTLLGLLGPNADLGDQFFLADLNLMVGETELLEQWLDSMEQKSAEKVYVLRELLQIREAELAAWPNVSATYANALLSNFQESQPGSSLAAAIGYHQEFFDELPPIQIPDLTKSRTVQPRSTWTAPVDVSDLQVFPNPTTGISYLVLSEATEVDLNVLVRDALGRTVQQYPMRTGARMLELDLAGLADGVYACEVLDGPAQVGSLLVTVKK
jgi:hypothetical protein